MGENMHACVKAVSGFFLCLKKMWMTAQIQSSKAKAISCNPFIQDYAVLEYLTDSFSKNRKRMNDFNVVLFSSRIVQMHCMSAIIKSRFSDF